MAYVRMWWSLLVVVAVLGGTAAVTDADNAKEKGPPKVKVKLQDAPNFNGKIAVYRGEVDGRHLRS